MSINIVILNKVDSDIMPLLVTYGVVQYEGFSKPHKRDLVGQSPGRCLLRLLNPSSCAARGLPYEAGLFKTAVPTDRNVGALSLAKQAFQEPVRGQINQR